MSSTCKSWVNSQGDWKFVANDSTPTFRKALLTDLPAILQIEQSSFSGDRFSKRQFSYLIRRAKASFLVAVLEEQVIGYSILLTPESLKSARIYSIAIHPDAKGKGIGKKLLEHHINIARTLKYQAVRLEVREDNLPAKSLYQSYGFRTISIKKAYYEDGMNALVLMMRIEQ